MAILGRNFIVKIDVAGGNNEVVVLGQKSGTITITGDTVETTTKGSGNGSTIPKTYQANTYGWEVTLSGAYDLGDTKGIAALVCAGSQATVQCILGADLPTSGEGDKQQSMTGKGIVTSFSSTGEQTDLATYEITIQGTGGLTIA